MKDDGESVRWMICIYYAADELFLFVNRIFQRESVIDLNKCQVVRIEIIIS